MRKIQAELQKRAVETLVVSFTPPALVAIFEKENDLGFHTVSDPTLAGYRAFGLGRTSLGSLLRPGVLFRFVRLILRGWLPKKPKEKQDILQLGGDFLLDSEGRVVFAHPSAEPTDRPSNAELLAAVTAAPWGGCRVPPVP